MCEQDEHESTEWLREEPQCHLSLRLHQLHPARFRNFGAGFCGCKLFCFVILFSCPLELHASPTKRRQTPLCPGHCRTTDGTDAWSGPGYKLGCSWPALGELRDARGITGVSHFTYQYPGLPALSLSVSSLIHMLGPPHLLPSFLIPDFSEPLLPLGIAPVTDSCQFPPCYLLLSTTPLIHLP